MAISKKSNTAKKWSEYHFVYREDAKSVAGRVLGAALMAGALLAAPAFAQTTAPLALDFPAQSLDQALKALAAKTGLPIAYDNASVAGKNAPALKGEFSAPQALQRLLAGSRLQAVADGAGYKLENGGEAVLSSILVTGARDKVAAAVNPATSVGSKVPLTQREIAQSLSVITHQQIEQQNARGLDEALQLAPGVFVKNGDSARSAYYSRGFQIDNVQIDGLPSLVSLATNTPNLTVYDRVEVLRGPAGLLNGVGSAGGAINLVRKKPGRDFSVSGALSAGTFGNYQQEVDVTGPLNEQGTLRGRAAGSLLNRGNDREDAHRSDSTLYAVLEYDVSPDTLLRVGGSYGRLHVHDQWTGYPTYTNGSFLKNANDYFLGADWNSQTYETSNVFAELEHKLGGGWSAKLSTAYLKYEFDSTLSYPVGDLTPGIDRTSMYHNRFIGSDEQTSLDLFAAGPYALFGRTHQLTVGVNSLRDDFWQDNPYIKQGNLFGVTPVGIGNANTTKPAFTGPRNVRTTLTTQSNLYANTRLSISDPLTLVLGTQLTWWESKFRPVPGGPFNSAATTDKIEHRFMPYAGLIYDIDGRHSLYASYSKIFKPQSERDIAQKLLKPVTGDQYEVGVKSEYFDGGLITSFALFQITERNRAMADPDPSVSTSLAQGEARGRGGEATISGKLLPNWDVLAGYTFTNTKALDSSMNPAATFTEMAPKHMFKLTTTYQLPGALSKWSVGGDARATSRIYTDYSIYGLSKVEQGGVAIVGARAAYEISPRLTAALSVTNLLDRDYYAQVGTPQGGNWPGDPRAVQLTLRGKF